MMKQFLQQICTGAFIPLSKSKLVSSLGPGVIAAVAIVVFVVLASWNVSLPGLQYDEVLFVQAAIGASNGLFVHQTIGPIPVMTMAYLGALKAWIYAPVFFLFGVSPITIRLPAILISALTLLLFYRLLRREVGTSAACLAVWVAALDTAFIFHSRLDWGPVVLATLFQIALLGCVLGFIRKPSWTLALAAGLFSVLGMWDKLNFVWFLAGVFVAALVCYPGLWISLFRKARLATQLIILSTGIVVALILALVGSRHWNLSAALLSFERIQQVWVHTMHTFSGTLLTSFLMNHPLEFPAITQTITPQVILNTNPLGFSPWPWILLLVLVPGVLVVAPLIRRKAITPAPDLMRRMMFFLVLMTITFFMIVVTPDSGHMHQSHHMMLLHPLHIILMALAFQMLLNLLPSRTGWVALSIFCGAVGWVVVTNTINTLSTLCYLGREERVDLRWSPGIYELARQLNESTPSTDWVISIDWGIHNQLLALGTPALRARLDDLWLELKFLRRHPLDAERILEKLRSCRRTLVVCYPASKGVQQQARTEFFRLLNREEIPIRLLTRIKRNDFAVYEVFEVFGKEGVRSDP